MPNKRHIRGKTSKPKWSRKSRRRIQKAFRTAREFRSRSVQFQETWEAVTHVVSRMRKDRVSLRASAKEFDVNPAVVLRLARPALRKQENGRYAAKKYDRLLRVLTALTIEGRQEIAIRDSRQASQLGSYWDAVQRYLQTGDDSALRKFQGKKITDASRKRFLLLTDVSELNRLGSAGVLSFESLYARGA
jgi:hypothetical protein